MTITAPAMPIQSEKTETLQKNVIDTLRTWAVDGTIEPQRKLSESSLAEALGVSRTPVRHALAVLVEEGVLERVGPRGYRIRTYTVADVIEAVEIRSIIEGYAARKVARKGPSVELVAALRQCLRDGDEIFAEPLDARIREQRYAEMNLRFHTLITEAAGGVMVPQITALLDRVPYGAPNALRFDDLPGNVRFEHLHHAHWQHHHIVSALIDRDSARVENLFREHGESVKISLGISSGLFVLGHPRRLPIVDPESPASHLEFFQRGGS